MTGTSQLRARIELGRNDGWRSLGSGQGRELSVQSASIQGTVRPEGLRYVAYHSGWPETDGEISARYLVAMFPVTAGAVASITFFCVSCSVFGLLLLPSAFRSMPSSVVEDVVKHGEWPSFPPARFQVC